MNEIIEPFTAILLRYETSQEGIENEKIIRRCQIWFNDATRLVGYEAVTPNKNKYSYQWMNEQNQTIFRWDNTPHFPQFDTFPAHRHVGEQEMGEPFAAVSLEDVLIFIASQLNP